MHPLLQKALTSKYLIFSVTAILLYALTGFIIAPRIIQWYAPRYVQQNLNCRLSIDKIRTNPFLLTISIDRFSLVQEDGQQLVGFDKLFVDLETGSLFRRAIVLQEVHLEKPDIHIVIESDGSINFSKLTASPPQKEIPASSDTRPLPLILQSATIQDGRIAILDNRQSTPAEFTLQGITLQLQDISTLKEHNGTYHLVAATKEGESLQWEGDLSFAPLRSKGKLSLSAIRIADLWEFVRDSANLEQPTGTINISTKYQISSDLSPVQLTLDDLHASAADISLKLPNSDTPFFQLKKLDLAASHFNLANQELRLSQVLLEDGAIDTRIDETGMINLQQISRAQEPEKQPEASRPPAASAAQASPFKVKADSIDVKNIAVHLDDKSRKAPINAEINGIDLHLQAKMELGPKTNNIVLQDIATELRGVSLHASSLPEPLFAMQEMKVEAGSFDLGAHALTFDRIAMNQGHVDTVRKKDGAINWQQLFQTKEPVKKSKGPEPAPEAAPAWTFLVKSFEVAGFKVKFSDLTTSSRKPVLSLQGINAKLTGVDGKSPMNFRLAFQMDKGGTAAMNGTVNPAIPSVEADLMIHDIVLTSLQPYIEPFVTLQLQSAAVSTQGHLRYGIPGDKQQMAYEGNFSLNKLRLINSDSKNPYLSWNEVLLSKSKLTLQPDKLDVQTMTISKPVSELIIGKDKTLNLAKVIKNQPAGKKTKKSSKTSAKQSHKNKKDDFAYNISRIKVQDGDIVFADLSLRPSFKTRIHKLKGSITGLSSIENAQAKVQLDGHVDQYGTAKINGVLRPHDFGRSSDISMIFQNVEMKNLSPYSGKFAGRLIQSGKLSADLQYKLQDYKMVGENKIIIDNLFLGEEVDDSEAGNLPLNLALALLKDADGRIDIGLPVTGDLNDPQFSIGPLIWKMFTNLIVKTATSPFKALGSLIGGGTENFDAVVFDPGDSEIPPPEQEKLLKLADALKSRPQINLVIQGRYSPAVDGLDLQERTIRRIVTTRLGTKIDSATNPEPLDFSDSHTQNILEKMYKERFGKGSLDELEKGLAAGTIPTRTSTPNEKAKAKKAGIFTRMSDNLKLYRIVPSGKSHEQSVVWAEVLYGRLAESEKIADKTFLELAENRSRAVAANITDKSQIPKERLIIKAPEPLSEDGGQPSVRLSLEAH